MVVAFGLIARELAAAAPVSPPVVEYTIEAKLDAGTHSSRGGSG